jgi:soluble epoxide hydrolase/lipid-phosphate phosphatase
MLELDEARRSGKRLVEAPSVAEDPECAYYIDTFRKGGIARPLSYYKIRKVNHDQEVAAGISKSFPAGIPTLFITGTNDTALPLSMSDPSPKYFSNGQYKREVVEGADHWLLQDARFRDQVGTRLVQWAEQQSRSRQARL